MRECKTDAPSRPMIAKRNVGNMIDLSLVKIRHTLKAIANLTPAIEKQVSSSSKFRQSD